MPMPEYARTLLVSSYNSDGVHTNDTTYLYNTDLTRTTPADRTKKEELYKFNNTAQASLRDQVAKRIATTIGITHSGIHRFR